MFKLASFFESHQEYQLADIIDSYMTRIAYNNTIDNFHEQEQKTLYDVLSVTPDAPIDQIKKQYRDQMRQYHPDVNQDPYASEKSQHLNLAYEVLNDTQKRDLYDQYLRYFKPQEQTLDSYVADVMKSKQSQGIMLNTPANEDQLKWRNIISQGFQKGNNFRILIKRLYPNGNRKQIQNAIQSIKAVIKGTPIEFNTAFGYAEFSLN